MPRFSPVRPRTFPCLFLLSERRHYVAGTLLCVLAVGCGDEGATVGGNLAQAEQGSGTTSGNAGGSAATADPGLGATTSNGLGGGEAMGIAGAATVDDSTNHGGGSATTGDSNGGSTTNDEGDVGEDIDAYPNDGSDVNDGDDENGNVGGSGGDASGGDGSGGAESDDADDEMDPEQMDPEQMDPEQMDPEQMDPTDEPSECEGSSEVDFGIAGWATEAGGTTGGQGGDVITVTDGAQLVSALKDKQDSTTPLTILIDGVITGENAGVDKIDIKDVSDVSLIGLGGGGEFNGIGIKVWRASNIIVRNLKIHHVDIGDKDCIGIEGPSDHIWIDHNELFNEYDGVDKDHYDGLLDAKGEAEYITYSWNHLHDSWKSVLVGSSDSDDFDRKVTMHHNFIENCSSRTPLFRFGNGHLYNNYYDGILSTAVNSRMGACLRIENNHFSNTTNPWVSAYSDALGGAELICNKVVDSVFDFSDDDVNEVLDCAANLPYDYGATLNVTAAVPDIVREHAGVGKLDDPTEF